MFCVADYVKIDARSPISVGYVVASRSLLGLRLGSNSCLTVNSLNFKSFLFIV